MNNNTTEHKLNKEQRQELNKHEQELRGLEDKRTSLREYQIQGIPNIEMDDRIKDLDNLIELTKESIDCILIGF